MRAGATRRHPSSLARQTRTDRQGLRALEELRHRHVLIVAGLTGPTSQGRRRGPCPARSATHAPAPQLQVPLVARPANLCAGSRSISTAGHSAAQSAARSRLTVASETSATRRVTVSLARSCTGADHVSLNNKYGLELTFFRSARVKSHHADFGMGWAQIWAHFL